MRIENRWHSFAFVLLSLAFLGGCATPHGARVTKQVVSTPAAPAAIGPYSQAIRHGDMLFVAGQIPIDPKTNQLMAAASIEDQTRLVLDNVKAVVEAAGMSMDDVVSTSVFLKDLNDFPKINEVYATYFRTRPPARATVEVARLPRDVKVEISAIAVR